MAHGTSNRGFASMDRDRQREIARQGGIAAHAKGTAHEFTAEEARVAGRLGGLNSHKNRSQEEPPRTDAAEDIDYSFDMDDGHYSL